MQILQSQDDELIYTSGVIMLRRSLQLANDVDYARYKKATMKAAFRSRDQEKIKDLLMIVALTENQLGNEAERDKAAKAWADTNEGTWRAAYDTYQDEYELTKLEEETGWTPETIQTWISDTGLKIVCV